MSWTPGPRAFFRCSSACTVCHPLPPDAARSILAASACLASKPVLLAEPTFDGSTNKQPNRPRRTCAR